MPVLALSAFLIDQFVQWRYGTAGALAVGIVSLGHKARNTTSTCIGLIVIALLITR
jgi:hypothetical protein